MAFFLSTSLVDFCPDSLISCYGSCYIFQNKFHIVDSLKNNKIYFNIFYIFRYIFLDTYLTNK